MQIIKGETSPCKLVDASGNLLAVGTHMFCTQVRDEILGEQAEDECDAKCLGTDQRGY